MEVIGQTIITVIPAPEPKEGETAVEPTTETGFDEIRKIGAFSNETLIDGVREIEILIQMRAPPTAADITKLATNLSTKMGSNTIETDLESAEIKGFYKKVVP